MKKVRILSICIAVGVLIWEVFLYYNMDAYTAIQNAYEDRKQVSIRINDTDDPKVLCVHDIETEEIAVQLAFRDITKDIEGLNHRYRLDISCRNKGETQYRYLVEFYGSSASLITDEDDFLEVTYGGNYSSGESRNRFYAYEFVPGEKQGSAGVAGEIACRYFRNLPVPTTGSVTVAVSVYLPYFDLKIHSFTQELTFPITEP